MQNFYRLGAGLTPLPRLLWTPLRTDRGDLWGLPLESPRPQPQLNNYLQSRADTGISLSLGG